MSDGTHDEPLPIDPQIEHPPTEWGTNGAAGESVPNPTAERPVRWTPLAQQLAQYESDGIDDSREIL
jgi:hypothetical protein